MPFAIEPLVARQKASWVFFSSVANGTIGAAAKGCGDIKDTTALAYQCSSTSSSQVKDVKLLTSTIFQWEDKLNAMLKEMKDPSVPRLWKMAAFLELCPNDIRDQVFLRIDEIKENYAVLREKVVGWAANKVEHEKSSGTAPMDIGEVDDGQSALQSHLY